jgi:hypothetical protein
MEKSNDEYVRFTDRYFASLKYFGDDLRGKKKSAREKTSVFSC